MGVVRRRPVPVQQIPAAVEQDLDVREDLEVADTPGFDATGIEPGHRQLPEIGGVPRADQPASGGPLDRVHVLLGQQPAPGAGGRHQPVRPVDLEMPAGESGVGYPDLGWHLLGVQRRHMVVLLERVGEDRLIEVAGRLANELFAGEFVQEVTGKVEPTTNTKPEAKPSAPRPAIPRKTAGPKRGVSFLEVVSLVQNYAPEDRIVAALQKYGIKFKPRESALSQLRSLGASETVISAIKSSNIVS